MKKLMALSGESRAALELWEEKGVTRFRLKPELPGKLWLCGGKGELFTPEGGRCPFDPVGALLVREGRVVLHGGFAGRRGLLEQARRQLYREEAPSPPAPRKDESPAQPQPAQPAQPVRPRQPAQPQPAPPAPNSQALAQILKAAQELFSPIQAPEPTPQNLPALNPFPGAFPLSRWRRVPYPGTGRHYLEGEMYKNGVTYIIHALPGEYRPGRRPQGFDRFLRGRDGSGYWVKVTRLSR